MTRFFLSRNCDDDDHDANEKMMIASQQQKHLQE